MVAAVIVGCRADPVDAHGGESPGDPHGLPTETASQSPTAHTGSNTSSTASTADTAADPGSSGCGSEGYRSGSFELDHGGVARSFRVSVPSTYDPSTPSPLVLVFHGWGGGENEFLGDSTVVSQAETRGYVVVAPLGLGRGAPDNTFSSWSFAGSTTGLDGDGVNPQVANDTEQICHDPTTGNYGYRSCDGVAQNGCSWTHCQDDDVDFVLSLLADVEANLCVDTSAVFATGGSNGGMFTWELGQNPRTAPSFRALAPLIGLPHRGYMAGPGAAAVPVLLVTGTRDPTVPPGEWEDASFTVTTDGDRYFYTGATAITRVWATEHGCDVTPAAEAFDDGHPQTDCRTYCGDDPDWPRVLDCRADMRHTYDFEWSWPLTLDFFDAHR